LFKHISKKPEGGRRILFIHSSPDGCGAYPVGTGILSRGKTPPVLNLGTHLKCWD